MYVLSDQMTVHLLSIQHLIVTKTEAVVTWSNHLAKLQMTEQRRE